MRLVLQICFLVTCLTIASCAAKNKNEGPGFSRGMQLFAENLAKAIPLLNKPPMLTMDERATLVKVSNDLSQLSQSVNHAGFTPSGDPTFQKTANALENELSMAVADFQSGRDRQAQRRLASATNYCIACHTMREGYENNFGAIYNSSLKGLSAINQAEFYAATRQFDQGLVKYEQALTDIKWAKQSPAEWNTAALKMLAIIVRVKNNPNLSLEMVSRFFDAASYPAQLNSVARIWQREIKAWEKSESASPTPITMAALERLIQQAEQLNKQQAKAGLIQDLRASRILHLLKSGGHKVGNNQQKLMLYSGQIAKRLHDLSLWEDPNDYFSACVKLQPKSKIASQCLAALKSKSEATK